ncbi:hypothetical protein ACFU8I_41670 [Streptomyces sp. NPDC057540]|uniref:hypothetical protein n=1 Tax=Streptomyces sp. NPDC057540 TaxID=3346160 RepID=UPI0036B2F9E8
MRPLATRRLTALAISAALALGTAGPAFAGEHHPPTAAERAARTPLPDATAPPTLADAPDAPGSVNTSVTELVAAALTSGSGRPSAADVEAFKAKIAAAVEEAKATAPAPLPDTPAPETPAAAPSADLPVAPPAGVVDGALASVGKAVTALLAAVTSGAAGGVVPQVTSTLTSLVDQAVAAVLGGGPPAPGLAGLPALPALPAAVPEPPVAAPELPVTPPVAASDLPVEPPPPRR